MTDRRKRKATDPAYRGVYTCDPTGCPGGDELWLPVVGHENIYEVSDHGRIRSVTTDWVDRRGRRRGRPGKIRSLSGLRPQIRLKKGTAFYVHHAVLDAFVGPRPEGTLCCHWDDRQRNNHVANLRWGTHTENEADKRRNGNDYHTARTHCPRGHLLKQPNLQRSEWAKGHRICLACHRGRARAVARGILHDRDQFVTLCDAYYAEITGEAAA